VEEEHHPLAEALDMRLQGQVPQVHVLAMQGQELDLAHPHRQISMISIHYHSSNSFRFRNHLSSNHPLRPRLQRTRCMPPSLIVQYR
jgi:hypothetical protein